MDSGFLDPRFAAALMGVLVLGFALMVLVGGALLRLATKWIGRFTPGYWRCCGVVALAGLLSAIVNFAVLGLLRIGTFGTGLSLTGGTDALAGVIVSSVFGYALSVVVTGTLVKLLLRGGDALSWPRAFAIAAAYLAMGLAIYFACIAVALLALGPLPGRLF